MMRRPLLVSWLTFAAMMLVPALAIAQNCADAAAGGGGSDTSGFSALVAKHGMIVAMAGSFGAGVVASLTPCVFPMVPVTVSVFGATETSSRARGAALSATFVLGIATLFVPLGVISAITGKVMGTALSNPFVIGFIVLVFAALAASMFGAFEIALPASVNSRLSTVGGIGFKGAFFIGLVMGLVAAPCTGPFLTGLLVWISTTKSYVLGGASMFAFSLGLGVPFFIAGTFAVNMPKGGAWMMGIKWVSGVVLAYMALSYLRDGFPKLAKTFQSPSAVYIALGATALVIGTVLGVVHVMAERRKSPIKRWSKPSKLVSIAPAILGMYMVFTWSSLPKGGMISNAEAAVNGTAGAPQIAWVKTEAEALARAKSEKKPVLIDFGATWCKACNELDEETWPDPKVRTEAARYVALKVDATDDDDPEVKRLSEKYGIKGLPVVLLIDQCDKQVVRYNEFVKPAAMVESLKKVQ
jgi:thiol:disulfide interchange protein DsbD